MIDKQLLELYYFRVTDLWKRLCEDHSHLFDLTCDEYSLLLGNKLDELEEKVAQKTKTIESINSLEQLRQELIGEISEKISPVSNVQDLLKLMQAFETEKQREHLQSFNTLLIDIIERIQEQNKKNQLFINKAIGSLRDIREGVMGVKSYSTYTARGSTRETTQAVE
jgi:flagellar biosynthesis/type III secretory pathway chaperone